MTPNYVPEGLGMTYQEEWDAFVARYDSGQSDAEFMPELRRLKRTNPVAHRELERLEASFKQQDGMKRSDCWNQLALFGEIKTYGGSETVGSFLASVKEEK